MKKMYKLMKTFTVLLCLIAAKGGAQVIMPSSGSNTIACGTNTTLLDPGGTGNYFNNDYGMTVIDAGYQAVPTISGTYQVESGWDYIYIYSGVGTGGTLLATLNGGGSYNYTGTAGVPITILFDSDGSVTQSGFSFNVSYTGICIPPPCVTTPSTNFISITNTLVCPVFGTSTLGLGNSYGLSGISYSWQVSTTSALGPFTNVIGANTTAYVTPTLNTTTWYQLTATCANGGSTYSLAAVQVSVANTTTNNVPYFESFEGITQNKQLPNCSWTRSDAYQVSTRTLAVGASRVPRTGTKFAEFDASNYVYYQTRYYYSNGIQMYAGVTYSASVWYITPGYSTWYNFGLLFGPNQTPTGLTQLAQVQYPNNSVYNSLSNTFQVPTSGIYYMAVRATEYGYGSYMAWDDLEVIAPCSYTNNAAPLVVTGPTQICAGQNAVFTASGAGTYSWTTGSSTSTVQVSPPYSTTYSITGTNSLTGCYSTIAKQLTVNQLPPVSIIAFKSDVCAGGSISMFAASANNYTWSAAGAVGPAITVTPAATTVYSVSGSDAFGCVGSATQQIVVNPLPVIVIQPSSKTICKGEAANLTASGATGATSYMWNSNSSFFQSTAIAASPQTSQTFTVTGTDQNGCTGVANVVVTVETCLGVSSVSANSNKATVFPSPNNGEFTVVLNNGLTKTIDVVDLTGRTVLSSTSENNEVKMNISNLSNGVYYVKVKSANTVEVLKVVKQ